MARYDTCGCDPWHGAGAGETIWRIFAIIYLFLGIAIICDDYFTASLETLSIRFKLSEDVAGATVAAQNWRPIVHTRTALVLTVDHHGLQLADSRCAPPRSS